MEDARDVGPRYVCWFMLPHITTGLSIIDRIVSQLINRLVHGLRPLPVVLNKFSTNGSTLLVSSLVSTIQVGG